MSGFNFIVFCSVLLVVGFQNARALSDDEKAKIFGDIVPHINECSKEFSTTLEQIKADSKAGNLDGCIMGCIFKGIGLINGEGKFDAAKALEHTKSHFSNADDVKALEDVINTCTSVNDKDVSDGAQGCERAKLIFECAKPLLRQLPFLKDENV